MSKKVYVAGSLFKDGDIKERKFEGKELRERGFDVFNPIEAPFNEDKSAALPTAKEIFWGDTKEVLSSDVFFGEYDGEDPGVIAEAGISWTINYVRDYLKNHSIEEFLNEHPEKQIVMHTTDIRTASSGEYDHHYVPLGYNQYVIGMIEDKGNIFKNKVNALNAIKK